MPPPCAGFGCTECVVVIVIPLLYRWCRTQRMLLPQLLPRFAKPIPLEYPLVNLMPMPERAYAQLRKRLWEWRLTLLGASAQLSHVLICDSGLGRYFFHAH